MVRLLFFILFSVSFSTLSFAKDELASCFSEKYPDWTFSEHAEYGYLFMERDFEKANKAMFRFPVFDELNQEICGVAIQKYAPQKLDNFPGPPFSGRVSWILWYDDIQAESELSAKIAPFFGVSLKLYNEEQTQIKKSQLEEYIDETSNKVIIPEGVEIRYMIGFGEDKNDFIGCDALNYSRFTETLNTGKIRLRNKRWDVFYASYFNVVQTDDQKTAWSQGPKYPVCEVRVILTEEGRY